MSGSNTTAPATNTIAAAATNICSVDLCCGGEVGVLDESCIICCADVLPKCFKQVVRKLEQYPESCHSEIFCSDTCCILFNKSDVDLEEVKNERSELLKKTFKVIIELAKEQAFHSCLT